MQLIKDYLKSRTAGWYVSLASFVFGLVTFIIYVARGGNSFSPVSGAAVAMLVLGWATNLLVLVKDFGVGAFVPYLFYIAAFGVLFNSEMAFVSNVFTSIDGTRLDGAFIACFVFLILTMATGFAACIMKLGKKK